MHRATTAEEGRAVHTAAGRRRICQHNFVDVSAKLFFVKAAGKTTSTASSDSLDSASLLKSEPEQVKMLDEATKHIREAIMLGRTDIIKKLLEEVWCSLSEAKGKNKVLSNKVL